MRRKEGRRRSRAGQDADELGDKQPRPHVLLAQGALGEEARFRVLSSNGRWRNKRVLL